MSNLREKYHVSNPVCKKEGYMFKKTLSLSKKKN